MSVAHPGNERKHNGNNFASHKTSLDNLNETAELLTSSTKYRRDSNTSSQGSLSGRVKLGPKMAGTPQPVIDNCNYFEVRHGNDASLLCNADCQAMHLRAYITRRCGVAAESAIDLSDDRGRVKHFRLLAPEANVKSAFKPRERLILLQVDETNDPQMCTFTPLLASLQTDDEYISIINHSSKKESKADKQRSAKSRQTKRTQSRLSLKNERQ